MSDPFGQYDYHYLKQLANNQAQTKMRSGMVDQVGRALGNTADVQAYVPPQIANQSRPEYSYQAAPDVSAERNRELNNQGNFAESVSGEHGASLKTPYKYDPDMQQRMTDTILSTYANLVKHLTPSK